MRDTNPLSHLLDHPGTEKILLSQGSLSLFALSNICEGAEESDNISLGIVQWDFIGFQPGWLAIEENVRFNNVILRSI